MCGWAAVNDSSWGTRIWRAKVGGACLVHRLARVLDSVTAFVVVDVVRLAVGEQQQQAHRLVAALEQR